MEGGEGGGEGRVGINALVKYLRAKTEKLMMCGEFCNRIELGDKKLIDYAAAIASVLGAHVAATGNTVLELKRRGITARKMWAAEVIYYLQYDRWKEGLNLPARPDTVIMIGYNMDMLRAFTAALKLKGIETVVLDNIEVEEATFSLPPLSISEWKHTLEALSRSLP